MTTGRTTTSQIDPAVQTFYDGLLLARAKPYLAHHLFGQVRPVDLKSGDTAKFRRYTPLPASTQPLVEGVTPQALQLAKTDITEQLAQFGAYVEYSDKVTFINEDPVLTELAGLLGDHAGLSLDHIYRDKLNAGSSVFYANAVGGRVNVITKVATADFDKIKRALSNAKAKFYNKNIKASTGIGTTPVRATYYCIVHPDVVYDIEGLTGFLPTSKYPDPGMAHENEVGSYAYFRFIESTEAKVWTGEGAAVSTSGLKSTGGYVDVYSTLIFAQDAYGVTPLKGKQLENIVKALGESGTADPLNQRGTSGWKSMTGLRILNDTWMYRYETGATA